ncbi:MAG: serine hydrolase [Bacteroidota bacterium]
MKRTVYLLFVVLFLASACNSPKKVTTATNPIFNQPQPETKEPTQLPQKPAQLPDELVDNINKRIENGANVGIAIGIIDENGKQYHNFGHKSLAGNDPVDEHSIFEIGSISKTFTTIILAQMVLEGKLALDDPVQKHLPNEVTIPKYEGDEITLMHMATHSSSMPRMPSNFAPKDPLNPYADYTVQQMYEFLNGLELTRKIGSQYEYSNLAMGLLGHVLELKDDTDFETMLKNRILDPLNMHETGIVFTDHMMKNLAKPHNQGMEVSNWDLPAMAGAGAIRSSAADMLNYLEANMGKSKSSLYDAMKLSHKVHYAPGRSFEVGLGWHLRQLEDGSKIIAHSGGTGGYRTFAAFSEDGKKGVLVFANSTADPSDIGLYLFDPNTNLATHNPSINIPIRETLSSKGIDAAVAQYHNLKENNADEYDFSEGELNNLGYEFLQRGKIDIALALFTLNTEAYPEAFNTWDSLAEGHMENGDNEKAIQYYKKSLELNPGNQNGIDMLKKIGYDISEFEESVEVADEILQSYVGKYEIAPSFFIEITHNDGTFMGQATGQPAFELFPKSDTEFYLKVVEARIVFSQNDGGHVESLTLFQNGAEMPGKKVE